MTPVVTALILANLAIKLLVPYGTVLFYSMAFIPADVFERPWTPLTYMFLHAPGASHILFNMLSLYFFGPALEVRLGSRHFLGLYLVSGIVGALCSLVTPYTMIVGASGATFGVTLGFAWFWPRQQIYLWGILGVEARVMVVVLTLTSLYFGATGGGGIAHFAHLGGFFGAWFYLMIMRRRSPAAQWQRKVSLARPMMSFAADVERYKKIDPLALHPVNRDEYNRVMTKLGTDGLGGLNASERDFLERFAPKA
jgi:membrane associated rhomboid family serine protease